MIAGIAAVVLASTPALAAPKSPEARKEFDRGVAAYKAKDYAAASTALGKSFGHEADVETLYAWAQAERQQNHCDKAIELYEKLLAFDLPAENRKAVSDKLDECKALVVVTKDEPESEPVRTASTEPPITTPPRDDTARTPEGRAWWKDPVGGALVGVGVVGLGVGSYFLVSARSADRDAKAATNYFDVEAANAKAESRGRNGVIGLLAGGALVAGGVAWYMTRGKSERTTVTGWIAPEGGGLAAAGRF